MAQNKSNTDNELILQIVGYNAEAFQQLFNRYSPSILGLIKEIISNPKLAESVLLNVFSVFLKRLDFFNTTSSNVFTYLTLLTRNISVDVLKRMKFVEDIPIYSDEYEIEFILPSLSQDIVQLDLDQRYLLGEQMKNYRSQLTEVQNLLLSLIYFEGLNEEEIAKRLNVPMVTVRQKVLSIMEVLHQQYAGQTAVNNNNKGIIELLKLEALGFLSSEERMMLANLKENDPDFLWKELGEYQNLTALISASIPEVQMPQNFNEEIMNIFTQILLQDGEVQYPIIASEIPIPEPELPKPVEPAAAVQSKTDEPEKVEKKDNGFQLKFREPDPAELNILRKLERVESNKNSTITVNKIQKEVQQQEIKPVTEKPDVIISRITNSPKPKEIINTTLKDDTRIQNKTEASSPISSANDILNEDPSIIIEESKPVTAPAETKPVSRLTPTSSINIDDIIRKDKNPPIKRNTLVENSKLSNQVQVKHPVPESPKQEKPKPVDIPKDLNTPKPAATEPLPAQSKPDITFKVNQVPKELREELRKVDKEPAVVESKTIQAPVEKFEIKIKSNEPPREIRPGNTVNSRIQDPVPVKSEKPTVPPNNIKVEAANPRVDLNVKAKVQEQIPKPIEPRKELQKPEIQAVNQVTPVENKSGALIPEPGKVNPKSADAEKLNSLFKTRDRRSADPVKIENPSSSKPGLKIRETKFVEDELKTEVKPQKDPDIDAIKSVVENIIKDKHLTGTLTVDEVLAKLNHEKPASKPAPDPEPIPEITAAQDNIFEEELNDIHKKRKIGILVSVAIFIIITVTGIFIYMKFQPDTIQAANDTKPDKPQKIVSRQTTENNNTGSNQNSGLVEQVQLPDETAKLNEKPVEEIKNEEKSVKDNQIKIFPVTNNFNTQDESYTTLNPNNQTKENNQTAAAKTENTTPPKENKSSGQENSVFVAVEEMPELVGGLKELQTKIKYPEIAKRTGVEGKVYIKAVVDENGNVISASTLKGIGAGCDEAAIDAVKNSKFIPGKQRGKNVKVEMTIPIVFKK